MKRSASDIFKIILAVLIVIAFLCALEYWECSLEDFNNHVKDKAFVVAAAFAFYLCLSILAAWSAIDCTSNTYSVSKFSAINESRSNENNVEEYETADPIKSMIRGIARIEVFFTFIIVISAFIFELKNGRALPNTLHLLSLILLIMSGISIAYSFYGIKEMKFVYEKPLAVKSQKALVGSVVSLGIRIFYAFLLCGVFVYIILSRI